MPEYEYQPVGPSIWIQSGETLPDTCITCGMFTDQRMKSKYTHRVQKTVATESGGMVALGCLLHLLGPIGTIVSALLSGGAGKTTEKTVTQKSTIKIPVCRLCGGHEVPSAIDGNPNAGRFLFESHSRFIEQLESLRTKQKLEDESQA